MDQWADVMDFCELCSTEDSLRPGDVSRASIVTWGHILGRPKTLFTSAIQYARLIA